MRWLSPASSSSPLSQSLVNEAVVVNDSSGGKEVTSTSSSFPPSSLWKERVQCAVATVRARAGGCRPLLVLLSSHLSSPLYVDSACKGLSSRLLSYVSTPHAPSPHPQLGRHPPLPYPTQFALELVSLGGVPLLLQAMARYEDDPQRLTALCQVLQGCCDSNLPDITRAVLEVGVGDAVMRVMRKSPRHRPLQEEGGAVIYHLCLHSPRQRHKVFHAGGVDLLLQAMSAHPSSPMIQEVGLGVILCLSLKKPSIQSTNGRVLQGEEEAQEVEGERDFPPSQWPSTGRPLHSDHLVLLFSAMRSHPSHCRIHQYGVALLEYHLVTLQSIGDTLHLSSLITQGDVVDRLMTTIHTPRFGSKTAMDYDFMYTSYLNALRVLATVDPTEIRGRVHRMNVMMSLLNGTDPDNSTVEVRRPALSVLDLIIRPHDPINTAIGRRGGLRFALHALRAHPTDVDMQMSACGILHHLCLGHKQRTREALSANALQALTVTLTTHTAEAEVEQRALRLIRCLLCGVMEQDHQEEERMISPSLIQAIVRAVHAQSLSEQVQEQGCHVMEELCQGTAVTSERRRRRKRMVVEAGGVAALQQVQLKCQRPHIRQAAQSALLTISEFARGSSPTEVNPSPCR